MPHWKVILTYDGTPWHGWQVQPDLPTVQGALAHAIHHITGETVLPQGSGRTDTGVHALGQVATFPLASPIPAANLHRALNRILPASIRILSVEEVPVSFHARHSARRKTYEYRILPGGQLCSPMRAPYLWDCRWELNPEALQQCAAHVLGEHDFTSFAATDRDMTARSADDPNNTADESAAPESVAAPPESPSFDASFFAGMDDEELTEAAPATAKTHERSQPDLKENPAHCVPGSGYPQTPLHKEPPVGNVRTIFHSSWRRQDDLLLYTVTGSGFLHHMVRNLVGTFVLAGSGRISPDDVPAILKAHSRSAAGPTAPARGLFLVEVIY